MGISSDISWTDATLNLWIGCTKVSPLCDHCYADRDNNRYKWVTWGPGQPRKRTSDQNWAHLRSWNRNPERVIGTRWPGRRPRVFINSYSDFFDNEVEQQWRLDGFDQFRECQNLDLILVTKRIGNVEKMLPPNWNIKNHRNTIILISVGNQDEADRDIPKLLALKFKYPWLRVGLSIEPMLGRIDLTRLLSMGPWVSHDGPIIIDALAGKWAHATHGRLTDPDKPTGTDLDWVIVGGESGGAEARPMHPDWARHLRDQCAAAGVAYHFKQHGAWKQVTSVNVTKDHGYFEGDIWHPVERWGDVHDKLKSHVVMERVGDKAAGRELDGKVYDGFVAAA